MELNELTQDDLDSLKNNRYIVFIDKCRQAGADIYNWDGGIEKMSFDDFKLMYDEDIYNERPIDDVLEKIYYFYCSHFDD